VYVWDTDIPTGGVTANGCKESRLTTQGPVI